MRRRVLLTAIVGGGSLAGCRSVENGSPSESPMAPPKESDTSTPARLTADSITATFRVVDGHPPTEDTADATFDDGKVTVTGTMDPSGCNRTTLGAVRYFAQEGVIHLEIGTEPRYATETVECGNASFDYRSVLSTEHDHPTVVELVHNYRGKDTRSFTLARG